MSKIREWIENVDYFLGYLMDIAYRAFALFVGVIIVFLIFKHFVG